VVFIGQYNAKRERHVDAIKRHEVALWHPSWRRAEHRFKGRHVIHRESAFGADCAAIYSSAEVSLNIVDDLNMPGHNMRTFEIPASSGVMLSSYTAEQAEFFPEGEAAWYYRDPVELDGLLERLLSDKEAQARTRTAALRMAQDHSYDKRAQELVAALLGKGT
jgi:spore maturation protein CgeB